MVSTPLLHCILHWTSLWQRPTTEWTGSNSVTSAGASHYRCLHISPIIPPDIGKPKIRAMQRLNNVNITMTDIRMKLSVVILKKKKTPNLSLVLPVCADPGWGWGGRGGCIRMKMDAALSQSRRSPKCAYSLFTVQSHQRSSFDYCSTKKRTGLIVIYKCVTV